MKSLTAFQIGLFGTIALLLLAALTQGCAGAAAVDAPEPTCTLVPPQPAFAGVDGWAYYRCPSDLVPTDEAQCARMRQPTDDPLRPTTWACDRPNTGPVLLAALSESGGTSAELAIPATMCSEFSGALSTGGIPHDGVTIWKGPIVLTITTARQTYATAADNCIALAPGTGSS